MGSANARGLLRGRSVGFGRAQLRHQVGAGHPVDAGMVNLGHHRQVGCDDVSRYRKLASSPLSRYMRAWYVSHRRGGATAQKKWQNQWVRRTRGPLSGHEDRTDHQ